MISVVHNAPAFQHQPTGSFDTMLSPMRKSTMGSVNDVVRVRTPNLMSDEEVVEAMGMVETGLAETPNEAMALHSGLDESRVMALLADL